MSNSESSKYCAKCKESKPVGAFGKDVRRPDGLFPYCKRCRLKNPERHDEDIANKTKGLRRCSACDNYLPPTSFYVNATKRDGLDHHCKDCARAYARAWAKRYPEKAKAKNKARYWQDPEREATRYREWYEANREEVIRKLVERSRTSQGKAKQAQANHLRRMREADTPATLTSEEWEQILDNQYYACLACGRDFGNHLPPTRDHVIPVSLGGGLTANNVVALCQPCNSSKGTRIIDYR